MIKALKILLNLGLVVFFVIFFAATVRAEVGMPEIIELKAQDPLILSGTAPANSEVLIYLDNSFIGRAEIQTLTASAAAVCFGPATLLAECQLGWHFQYNPIERLTDNQHLIIAIAQDRTSLVLSAPTSERKFTVNTSSVPTPSALQIELPMPAPTIFKPIVNNETISSRPFIVGLAKNDSRVKIYIDKKYDGELLVKNHPSGTANFAYKPAVALIRGAHSVYAVAADKRGKTSVWSNTIEFSTKSSAIAQSAEEEKQEAIVEIKEPQKSAEIKSEPVVISESSGAVIEKVAAEPAAQSQKPTSTAQKLESTNSNLAEKEIVIKQELKNKEAAALEKIKSLIGTGAAESKSDRGMINEGKQNQGRLKLDLILFILFLVGVVAWLLWVNRELVKERRAQTEIEEKAVDNKSDQPGRGQDNKLF